MSTTLPRDPGTEGPPVPRGTLALGAAVSMLILAVLIADVQGISLGPLVGTMMADLSATATEVGWVLNSFTIAGAVTAGILARAGDIYGHRRILIPIAIVGLAGAVISALGTTWSVVAGGRFLLGMGLPTVALLWGVIRPFASARQVQRVSVTLATCSSIGVATAALLGGVFIVNGVTWKALFWLTAAAYVALFLLLLGAPKHSVARQSGARLDVVGGVGLGLWLVAILIGLSNANSTGFWSAQSLVPLGLGIALLVAWVFQQIRTPHRLMSFHRDDARLMLSGFGGAWSVYIASPIMFTLVPSTLQAPVETGYGFGLDGLASTLPLITMIPAALIAQAWTPLLLRRWGPRLTLSIATFVGAVGFLGLAFYRPSFESFFLWVFIFSIGLLTAFPAGMALTTASARHDNSSITVGTLYAGGSLSGALGTAAVIAVLSTGSAGAVDGSTITTGFIVGGAAIAALAVTFLFLVPRAYSDKHAKQ